MLNEKNESSIKLETEEILSNQDLISKSIPTKTHIKMIEVIIVSKMIE